MGGRHSGRNYTPPLWPRSAPVLPAGRGAWPGRGPGAEVALWTGSGGQVEGQGGGSGAILWALRVWKGAAPQVTLCASGTVTSHTLHIATFPTMVSTILWRTSLSQEQPQQAVTESTTPGPSGTSSGPGSKPQKHQWESWIWRKHWLAGVARGVLDLGGGPRGLSKGR